MKHLSVGCLPLALADRSKIVLRDRPVVKATAFLLHSPGVSLRFSLHIELGHGANLMRLVTLTVLLTLMDCGGNSEPATATATARMKTLCLGDSITVGNDSPGGYRGYLFAAMPALNPVGTQTSNSISTVMGSTDYDKEEGHPGFTAVTLAADLPGYLSTIGAGNVDVVLLNIGVNDSFAPTVPSDIANMYESIVASSPSARVLVACPPVPPQRGSPAYAPWQALIPALTAKVMSLPMAMAVDMSVLTDSDHTDPIHPNSAGYLKMSLAWQRALMNLGLRDSRM